MIRSWIAASATAALVALVVAAATPRAGAQGQVVKPLDPTKIAAERVVIRQVPYVIATPGRYVLAGGLGALPKPEKGSEFGIAITCDDVELDLDGALLAGAEGCTSGIVAVPPAQKGELVNVTVRNGTLAGWPGWGVDLRAVRLARVERVHVLQNGTPDPVADVVPGGLRVGASARLLACSAARNAGPGLMAGAGALVRDCTSDGNGKQGLVLGAGSSATDCLASGNKGAGLLLDGAGARAEGCIASSNGGDGIVAQLAALVQGCSAVDNAGYGVLVQTSCVVSGCTAAQNGQGGVLATLSGNRLEGNHVSGAVGGIEVRGANNLVVGNSVTGSPLPYTIAERNLVGPIHRAATEPDALIIRSAGAPAGGTAAPVAPPPAWANFAP